MNTALWIVWTLALLSIAGSWGLGRWAEGMGDGGIGIGALVLLGRCASVALTLVGIVLSVIKLVC